MKTYYEANDLIIELSDVSIRESGIADSLTISNCTEQQLTTIIDYLVEYNLASNLLKLDLCRNPLTSLPDSFGNLSGLVELDLSFTELASLPDSFGNLKRLRTLCLQKCNLSSMPESLCRLSNLVSLDLSRNKLESLPESIENLISLERLTLGVNNLISLPDSFGNLKYLEFLDIYGNRLTSLPDSFGDLYSLKKLFLACNNLTSLPESFDNLNDFSRHDLQGIRLKTLPITAHNWQSRNLKGNRNFIKLQQKLQKEIKQFSDILTGLVATYFELRDILINNPNDLDSAKLEELNAICKNFFVIFFVPSPELNTNIFRYALNDSNDNSESQLLSKEHRFKSFFLDHRWKRFKELKQSNEPLLEWEDAALEEKPPAFEPRYKQPIKISRMMFTAKLTSTIFLALLASVIYRLYYSESPYFDIAEQALDPDRVMNGL